MSKSSSLFQCFFNKPKVHSSKEQSSPSKLDFHSEQLMKLLQEHHYIDLAETPGQEQEDQNALKLLKMGMQYLHTLTTPEASEFVGIAFELMNILSNSFEEGQEYHIWTRFCDISAEKAKLYEGKQLETFKEGVQDILNLILVKNQKIDWRIARKIAGVKNLLTKPVPLDIDNQRKGLITKIEQALEYLTFHKSNASSLHNLVRDTLNGLKKQVEKKNQDKKLEVALSSGRFDKKQFGLKHTLILSGEGHMWLLLNHLSQKNQKDKDYKELIEKYGQKQPSQDGKMKLIVRKTPSEIIKVGLSLFCVGSITPSQTVCIRKLTTSQTGALEEFYSGQDDNNLIYTPKVYDIAVMQPKEKMKKMNYMIMEILKKETAEDVFKETNYQKWEYQKPYLVDVLTKYLKLFISNKKLSVDEVCVQNTLFDTNNLKSTLINVRYNLGTENTIDEELSKVCGKILKQVTQSSDLDVANKESVDTIANELTQGRMSLVEAISELKVIGDDNYKDNIIFTHYIAKIKERLAGDNKSSISINQDIDQTNDMLIDMNTTDLNPLKYKGRQTKDLSKQMDEFFSDDKVQVMALFGAAGSGKSIALQLRFIDAVKNWKVGLPVPIYFNLANGVELVDVLASLNGELGTNLSLNTVRKQHFYIDSFDEGIGMQEKRNILIKEYSNTLGNPKMLITCRTDYIQGEQDHVWFKPSEKAQVIYSYITPINYTGHANLEGYIQKYLTAKSINEKVENIVKCLNEYKLKDFIDTGFMFHIIMNIITSNSTDALASMAKNFDKYTIYKAFITNFIGKTKFDQDQEMYISQKLAKISPGSGLSEKFTDICKFIACQLHLTNRFRLDQSSIIFSLVDIDDGFSFKNQTIYQILRNLPLKIETKVNDNNDQQEISIGFIHDTVKNYFLFEAILEELTSSGYSAILATKRIVENPELIRFIVQAMRSHKHLIAILKEGILKSKQDKSKNASVYATNCMTILVAARHLFDGDDFSNVAIPEAILRNGTFRNVNFTGANMSNTNLMNVDLYGAVLKNTNLKGATFGRKPDLWGNDGSIWSVSYAPDGRHVLTASENKVAKIWDTSTYECVKTLAGHTDFIHRACYAPDGRHVATASGDKMAKIWDTDTGNCLHTLEGHTNSVWCICYNIDGTHVASGAGDRTVKIWDTTSGNCLQTVAGHAGPIWGICYTSDNKRMATASGDKTVKIWDTDNYNCLITLSGHTQVVRNVCFTSNGRFVASGGDDHDARIWDTNTGVCLQTLRGHSAFVYTLSYTPDDKYLATASGDETVRIWDTNTGDCLQTLRGHIGSVFGVCYAPDGIYMTTCGSDGSAKIWDTKTSDCLQNLQGHTAFVHCSAYTLDGKLMGTASADKTVKIWDTTTGDCLQTLEGHTAFVNSVSFRPDGKSVTTGCDDKTAKIWDTETGKCLFTLNGHTNLVRWTCYSPDGKYVATCSDDKKTKIWDTNTGECVRTLEGHTGALYCVCYSPDGSHIVTASQDESVKIWNANTGDCLKTLKGHSDLVHCVCYAPDGKNIATCSADSTAKIWDLDTGNCLKTLKGHSAFVCGISYAPDGKHVVTGGVDKTIKIWDVNTGDCLKTLAAHTHVVRGVCWAPDGKHIATSSEDQTVRVWSLDTNTNLTLKTRLSHEASLNLLDVTMENCIISTLNQKLVRQFTKDEKPNVIVDTSDPTINQHLTLEGLNKLLLPIIFKSSNHLAASKPNHTSKNIAKSNYYLGRVQEVLEKRNVAKQAYAEALQQDPKNFKLYLRRAVCLNKLGEYNQAIEDLKTGLRLMEEAGISESSISALREILDIEEKCWNAGSEFQKSTFWRVAWIQTLSKICSVVNVTVDDLLKKNDLTMKEELISNKDKMTEKLNYLLERFNSSHLDHAANEPVERKKVINEKIDEILIHDDKKEQKLPSAKTLSSAILGLLQNNSLKNDVWNYFKLMSRENASSQELQSHNDALYANLLNDIRGYLAEFCKNNNKNKGLNVDFTKGFDRLNVQAKYEIKRGDLYTNAQDFNESFYKLDQLYSRCAERYDSFNVFMNWTNDLATGYNTKISYASNLKSKFRVLQKHRELGYDVENELFLTNAHSNIWDILRCTFFIETENVEKDIDAILALFNKKELKIVRIKDKVKTHLQNIMINFVWDGLACELQVCFNLNKEKKHALHFAYELERCQNVCELFFTLIQTEPLNSHFKEIIDKKQKVEPEDAGVVEMYKEMDNIVQIFSK